AATSKCAPNGDYTKFLKADGLKGARIGIPRAFYYDKTTPPGAERPRGGFLTDEQKKQMAEAIDVLKNQGAVIVDPADIPSVVDKDRSKNPLLWCVCASSAERVSGGIQCEAGSVRRQFSRHRVQRADADPIGLCVRAGDEEARAAAAAVITRARWRP